jgi:hypothetical protein
MPVGRPHRLALTVVLALAAAASCAPADDGTPSASSAPSEDPSSASRSVEPESPEPVAVADVLRFTAPRLGGGTVVGEDLAGDDVAFWFWAPW